MLTKEKCEKALDHFEKCYWDQDNSYGAMNGVRKDLDILNKLIHEHFDNPPLGFEELKPNMRVWDNEMKEWIQIVHLTNFLGATKFVNFYINGLSELIDSEYEPNRFYRKEVKDVD